jgi:hypothetical protein
LCVPQIPLRRGSGCLCSAKPTDGLERLYLCGLERIENGEEANTQWVKKKTSRFSYHSTGF